MLSKMYMLVLGIIKEAPINPYEIIRLFGELNVKLWLPHADSSIYAGINALMKKDYIKGEGLRTGKMPEKSVYSITDKGVAAFEENLRAFFLDVSGDYMQLTVAIFFVCHLPKNEVLELLIQRLNSLQEIESRLLKRIQLMREDSRIPSMSVMTAKNHLHYIEAGIRTTIELQTEVEQFTAWSSFLSKELI